MSFRVDGRAMKMVEIGMICTQVGLKPGTSQVTSEHEHLDITEHKTNPLLTTLKPRLTSLHFILIHCVRHFSFLEKSLAIKI